MDGKFITFEGPEGCGKSTQLSQTITWLKEQGKDVVSTFEPGDTALGKEIRRLLLSGEYVPVAACELLLFLAGIALLVVEIFIIPGFGLTGIAGLLAIGVSLILSQQDFLIPKWDWQWDVFNRNVFVVFIGFISSIGLISLLMILFPRLSIFNRLILNNSKKDGSTPCSFAVLLFPD